jgi:hypothetical protein
MLGEILIGIGAAIVVALLIINNRKKPRVSGFSSEDVELLTMPAHEQVARQLARYHGAPEFMWRRYTALAVSIILARNP